MNTYLYFRGLYTKKEVRSIGVIQEYYRSFRSHIKAITKSDYNQWWGNKLQVT